MTEEEKTAFRHEFARGYLQALFRTGLRTGDINPSGKSDEDLERELVEYTYRHLDELRDHGDIHWAIDHTETLLASARRNRRRGDHHLSILLYATWSEHWVNGVISSAGRRKGLGDESIEQAIRDTPFRGKVTWLLQLLGMPPLRSQYLDTLNDLLGLRNGFVHYKWVAHGESVMDQQDQQRGRLLEKIESLVRYLNRYEDRIMFQSARCRIERLFPPIDNLPGSGSATDSK